MPLIYRVMKRAEDGGPAVGRSPTSLGVRIPQDISPDDQGNVAPALGGMSVSPRLVELPKFLVPKRLVHLLPSARGSNNNFVWRMGAGPFVAGAVAPGLLMQPDRPGHGTVQPESVVPLPTYEAALVATRSEWAVDESGV